MSITIAIDAMGGDHGPEVTVAGAVAALRSLPQLRLILVGDQKQITQVLTQLAFSASSRLEIIHTTQCVAMDEPPAVALRTKKDSSMRIAINLVHQKRANACVSAGNTGALVATARFVLKMLPGIDKPAIISALPTVNPDKSAFMLDLGANVNCNPDDLFQFAIMGSIFVSAVTNQQDPTVALLNVGAEAIKGNTLVKEAALRLSGCSALNYIGFVEANDITRGLVDLVVCDGFAGNVALKAIEGLAYLISHYLREALSSNLWAKLLSLGLLPVLKRFKKKIDPGRYNGACLLGLQGIVVKSHGGAKDQAFARAIEYAFLEVQGNIPEKIATQLSQLFKSDQKV